VIIISGSYRITPEGREEYVEAAAEMLAVTRSEAGCRAYEFSFAVEEPDKVNGYEEWEDDDAVTAHMGSAHMAAFGTRTRSLITSSGGFFSHEVAGSSKLF